MKTKLLLLSLVASSFTFAQSKCCDVVDSAGEIVITSNSNCVITSAIPSDCTEEEETETVPQLNTAEKTVLIDALEGVKFKSNSDVLLEDSYSKLDAVAKIMENHPDFKLTINGYTDNTGASKYNHQLSLKRANAAKARLIEDGIEASRITTHGYGEENPIDTNDTPEGRAHNRRVEFIIN